MYTYIDYLSSVSVSGQTVLKTLGLSGEVTSMPQRCWVASGKGWSPERKAGLKDRNFHLPISREGRETRGRADPQ
jgi:hypothetical protein